MQSLNKGHPEKGWQERSERRCDREDITGGNPTEGKGRSCTRVAQPVDDLKIVEGGREKRSAQTFSNYKSQVA